MDDEGINLVVGCSVNIVKKVKNPVVAIKIENDYRSTQSPYYVTVNIIDFTDGVIQYKDVTVQNQNDKNTSSLTMYEEGVGYVYELNAGLSNDIHFKDMINCSQISEEYKVKVLDLEKEASFTIRFAKNIF